MVDNTMTKRTNNNLQNITHKTKDRVTRTTLKSGVEFSCCGRVSSTCSTTIKIMNNISWIYNCIPSS
jgi:hypothetical protein